MKKYSAAVLIFACHIAFADDVKAIAPGERAVISAAEMACADEKTLRSFLKDFSSARMAKDEVGEKEVFVDALTSGCSIMKLGDKVLVIDVSLAVFSDILYRVRLDRNAIPYWLPSRAIVLAGSEAATPEPSPRIIPDAEKQDGGSASVPPLTEQLAAKHLGECVDEQVKDAEYSSSDGGKSVVKILWAKCQKQANDWVNLCKSTGEQEGDCKLETAMFAQMELKRLGR